MYIIVLLRKFQTCCTNKCTIWSALASLQLSRISSNTWCHRIEVSWSSRSSVFLSCWLCTSPLSMPRSKLAEMLAVGWQVALSACVSDANSNAVRPTFAWWQWGKRIHQAHQIKRRKSGESCFDHLIVAYMTFLPKAPYWIYLYLCYFLPFKSRMSRSVGLTHAITSAKQRHWIGKKESVHTKMAQCDAAT